MVLLIDNYDSFVHNLARYCTRLGQETRVVRNDALSIEQIRALKPSAIILSPGPCAPMDAGCSLAVVRELHQEIPILGVCLGHQAIGQAFGGAVVRATEPRHGRASQVHHQHSRLFTGIPSPFQVGRYHSLIVEESSLPADLHITARAADGTIMAIEHAQHRVVGVQFHPESILTEHGYALLANFFRLADLPVPSDPPNRDDELSLPTAAIAPIPDVPVTF